MDLKVEKLENAPKGKGYRIVKHLIGKEQYKNSARLYAEVTLKEGCAIGYHDHHKESETYYILSGEGIYNDNGTMRRVKKGDVTFTGDGMGHGLENASKEDLVFVALILLDK